MKRSEWKLVDLFEKKSKILSTFFLGRQIDFPSSATAPKRPCFGQIVCAAGKILKKKQAKKDVLGFFGKFWLKNRVDCFQIKEKTIYETEAVGLVEVMEANMWLIDHENHVAKEFVKLPILASKQAKKWIFHENQNSHNAILRAQEWYSGKDWCLTQRSMQDILMM